MLKKDAFLVKSTEEESKFANSTYFEQIKDEVFEETEKNFRMQERLIKSFIRDLSLYLQHIRVSKDLVRIADSVIPAILLFIRHIA